MQLLIITAFCSIVSNSLGTEFLQENDFRPDIYSLHILSNIRYRYAHTLVSSRVANPTNISQEITFSMVLPETAFISGFLMEVDGKVFNAYVKEKEEAKKEYTEAIQKGQTAGHVALSARDSNRFTVSVNVEAEKKVTFNLTYEELLTRKLGSYKHVINLDPGQIVPDFSVQVFIEESSNITTLEVPAVRTSNEIDASPIEGATNPLARIERPSLHSAEVNFAPTPKQQEDLASDGIKGQLIVHYDLDRSAEHSSQLLVNDGYFAHYFAPEHLEPLLKHVIFVLDISGSMAGSKLQQLKEAMNAILEDLRLGDYFSLVIFDSYIQVWSGEWGSASFTNHNWKSFILPATSSKIHRAKQAIQDLKVRGATNIHDAMKIATHIALKGKGLTEEMSLKKENSKLAHPEPIIIFLTDGDPTEGETNIDKIIIDTTNWNRKSKASIFSLALGESANLDFLKKLSLRNSGYGLKIYDATDTALQLKDFYQQVATPLLANITFNYEPEQVDILSLTKNYFVSFYSGSEIVVSGHLDHGHNPIYKVTGRTQDGLTNFEPEQPVVVVENENYSGFVERLWAYLRIQQLLDEEKRGYGKNSAVKKQEATKLALKYSFVTPVTSLVVVRPDGEDTNTNTERADKAISQVCHHCTGYVHQGTMSVYPSHHNCASDTTSIFIFVQLLYMFIIKYY